jgi:hypothetical protein
MNNEQQELLDEVYKNYVNKCNEDKWMKEIVLDLPFPNKSYGLFSHEEFINKCKTDPEFSEKWGLKIEERELSLEERNKWSWDNWGITCEMESVLDEQEVPTRLITVIYKEQTIESYE